MTEPKKAARSTKKAAAAPEHEHETYTRIEPDSEAVAAAEADPKPIDTEPTVAPEPPEGDDGLPMASPDKPAMPREKAHAPKEAEPEPIPVFGDPDRPRDESSAPDKE